MNFGRPVAAVILHEAASFRSTKLLLLRACKASVKPTCLLIWDASSICRTLLSGAADAPPALTASNNKASVHIAAALFHREQAISAVTLWALQKDLEGIKELRSRCSQVSCTAMSATIDVLHMKRFGSYRTSSMNFH